jgi:DNA replication and repair protein recF
MELCQLSKIYVDSLINYNKILAQRNKLLKDISFNADKNELLQSLDIWDIQLIHYGSEIIKYRKDFIEKLNIYIKDIHSSITGEKESLYIKYDMNIDIDQYENAVLKTRDNDIKYKMTSVGPHRDDISFFIKNSGKDIDLKYYGSQGQQRTAALSLKLAEIELVKKSINDYPILLLDDVFSELDVSRQKRLIRSIKHLQTIITSTGIDDLLNKNFSIDNIMKVKEAKVSSVKEFTKII